MTDSPAFPMEIVLVALISPLGPGVFSPITAPLGFLGCGVLLPAPDCGAMLTGEGPTFTSGTRA